MSQWATEPVSWQNNLKKMTQTLVMSEVSLWKISGHRKVFKLFVHNIWKLMLMNIRSCSSWNFSVWKFCDELEKACWGGLEEQQFELVFWTLKMGRLHCSRQLTLSTSLWSGNEECVSKHKKLRIYYIAGTPVTRLTVPY